MALKKQSRPFDEYLAQSQQDNVFTQGVQDELSQLKLIHALTLMRKQKNISQTELAHRLKTKQSNISRYEQGLVSPTFEFLLRVAHALDVSLEFHLKSK